MNVAIRAVVRVRIGESCEVFGVYNGYSGLVAGEITQMGTRSVGGIIQPGGTC
jgi:6-phosphofructokinase 1